MIRFASLGSGSAGNALLVESGEDFLLIDCGFPIREVESRMQGLKVAPDTLTGILVTHEHGDHVGGVFRLARKYRLPVWLTHGTLSACQNLAGDCDVRVIDSHSSFSIGKLTITPFPVPHDAREPVQYRISNASVSLGVATDLGEVTPHVWAMLSGCEGLVLEFNHDAELLARSRYPASLKRRIAGRLGHLENSAAANLLRQIDCSRLQVLVAAHLSEQNNRPELVARLIDRVMGCGVDWPVVATADSGFGWRCLT